MNKLCDFCCAVQPFVFPGINMRTVEMVYIPVGCHSLGENIFWYIPQDTKSRLPLAHGETLGEQ